MCAAEDLSTAEGGAGDTGENVGHDDGGDVGVHLVGQHHGEVHEVLEAGTGVDDGGEAHQGGGQQEGVDAGEEAGHQVLHNMALEILVVGDKEDDGAHAHGGIDAVGGAHVVGQDQLQNDDNDVGQDGQVDGGQLLAAGAAGDELSVALGGHKADAAGPKRVGGPGEVEHAEAEGHDEENDGHGGGGKGGDAQLLGKGDAQHGGGAGGDHVQDHGAIQEDGGHQQLGDVCLAEHGDSHRVDGEDDDEGVDTAVGQQEGDDEGAGHRGLYAQEAEKEVCNGLGCAALFHQLTVRGADGEQEQIRAEGAAERGGIGAGEGPPEGKAAGDNNDDGADQRGDKAVDSLEGEVDQDCNAKDHADHTDDLHNDFLSFFFVFVTCLRQAGMNQP